MNVHDAPHTEKERLELLQLIAIQERQIFEDKTQITCAGCGRVVLLHRTFRCFFCELIFCKACARVHFGRQP